MAINDVPCAAREPGRMKKTTMTLTGLCDSLNGINNQARSEIDRLIGSRPEAPVADHGLIKGTAERPYNNEADELDAVVQRIGRMVERTGEQMERLRNL